MNNEDIYRNTRLITFRDISKWLKDNELKAALIYIDDEERFNITCYYNTVKIDINIPMQEYKDVITILNKTLHQAKNDFECLELAKMRASDPNKGNPSTT